MEEKDVCAYAMHLFLAYCKMGKLPEGRDRRSVMSILHEIEPIYDKHSRILILGSFPSVKSREAGFFYGHPQNRFWKVLASMLEAAVPETIEEKKKFLHANHIALWDVIASCDIVGSSDSSIRNVKPTDIRKILETADIQKICCNGGKAFELYEKYQYPVTGRKAEKLPSTSPANAAWSLEKLVVKWKDTIFPG